jgi:O-antigen/teichoic acid export membrane protein
MFFEFGLFVPAARMAAGTDGEEARRVFGAGIVSFVPIGAGYLLAVAGLSFGVDGWFHVQAGNTIRLLAPLFLIYPFQFLVMLMSQGMRRLHVLWVTQACAALLTLGLIAGYILSPERLTLASALYLTSGAQAAGLLVATCWLRPLFEGVRRRVDQLLAEARRWGFQIYVGRVLSIGTYNIDVLMVAAFTGARQVAFYAIAGSIAQVVTFPATSISAALFPRMARERRLRRSWEAAVWCFGIAGAALVWSVSGIFVHMVLGKQYLQVVPLVLPLALAAAIRGVTALYNTYLGANARGRELRSAGLVLTGANLVLNFGLIPAFGATGAAWASFLALLANYVAHVVFYRRSLRAIQTTAEPVE